MDGLTENTGLAVPDVSAIVSPSGRRRHVRVAMPVLIELDGAYYKCRDWSAGGCALDGDGPALDLGQMVTLRVRFDLGGTQTFAEVQAQVVRRKGPHVCAFQFLDAAGSDTMLLQVVALRWLRGDAMPATMPEAPRLPGPAAQSLALPAPGALPSLAGLVPIRSVRRARLRQVILTLLGASLVAAALGYVVVSRTTVYSDYAAVTSDLQVVRAAVDGLLQETALLPGGTVHAGQVVGRLQPVITPLALATAKAALELAQSKVTQQQAFLESLGSGYGGFIAFAERVLADAAAARVLMVDQLAAEQRVYDRLRTLATTGTVSPLRADQEQVNLRTQQHALMLARQDEAAAKQRLDDARRGRFITDGRSTQLAPTDVARDLAVLIAQRDSAAATLNAMSGSTPLVSPCECVVATVVATDQTFVQVGNPIANLAMRYAGTIQVDALVPSGLMSFLRTGQDVRVFLSDRTAVTHGTITVLNYNPVNTGRVGLPDTLRTLNNYGLVTVTLHDVGETPVGTPAVINVSVSAGMVLRNLPGLAALFGEDGPKER